MIEFFEKPIAAIWNRLRKRQGEARQPGGTINLGFRVVDDEVTRRPVTQTDARRAMHLALLGRTGSGKSFFIKNQLRQDIEASRGFFCADLHGDLTEFVLRTINARERRLRCHLSDKLIVIDPTDPELSVGLNFVEHATDFVHIARFVEVLKRHWGLDHFGPRTDELMRNSLYVVAANGLTLVELAPFLVHPGFRAACLKNVPNAEVKQYFELRYDQTSEAMRAVMREPILNKTSAFTSVDAFRHIVGQAHSTFSIKEAMDEGHWVIVNLDKGRLGEQSLTLGSLMLTVLKNALFAREKRSLFTCYLDEMQNFLAFESGIETMLSEARKFGVAVVSANQFLDQYPAEMRAAIMAVGTHAFFQLSSADANQVAQALDGGKSLAERLKNLPQRHCIVKSGSDRWLEVCVPSVQEPTVDYTDLVNRSRYARGRVRAHIERDIAKRQELLRHKPDEVLHDWE